MDSEFIGIGNEDNVVDCKSNSNPHNLKLTDYIEGLSKRIAEPIYLTNRTDEVKKEIYHNLWTFTIPSDIINQASPETIIEFVQKVKDQYRMQLQNSNLEIDLIFYIWFEEPGLLYFNFINSNHSELPFGCKFKILDSPEEIIEQFLKSKYPDNIIPWGEFKDIVTPEEMEEADRLEKELHEKYILSVYSETITKPK